MILRLSPKSSIYLYLNISYGLKGQNCQSVFFPYLTLQFCVIEHEKLQLSLLSSLSFQPENMNLLFSLISLCPSLSFKKHCTFLVVQSKGINSSIGCDYLAFWPSFNMRIDLDTIYFDSHTFICALDTCTLYISSFTCLYILVCK